MIVLDSIPGGRCEYINAINNSYKCIDWRPLRIKCDTGEILSSAELKVKPDKSCFVLQREGWWTLAGSKNLKKLNNSLAAWTGLGAFNGAVTLWADKRIYKRENERDKCGI